MKQFPDPALNVPRPRPRPRPTRKRRNGGWWFSDGCVGVFAAIIGTPIWLFFALRATGEVIVAVAGHTIHAPVVAARFVDAKGGGHLISYRYGAKAEDVDEIWVRPEEYDALPVGSLLPVKTFGMGALISSRVPFFAGRPPIAFYFQWFPLCFFGFVLYACWDGGFCGPRRLHWLLQNGIPARGQIRKIDRSNGRHKRYSVNYIFPDGMGRQYRGWVGGLESRPELEEGDSISVLFDPNDPHISTIYELLPEEVDTGSASS